MKIKQDSTFNCGYVLNIHREQELVILTMSSDSLARGRSLLQISMVNTVLELLNMDVMELISAARSAANIIPRTPTTQILICLLFVVVDNNYISLWDVFGHRLVYLS